MSNQLILPRQLDANGDPVSGAKANIYQSGTTTPVTVYTDTALSVAHANPIVADAQGYFAQAFYGGTTALKVVFTDANDVTLYTFDPAPLTSLSDSNADDVTSVPFTGVTATNVQDALEQIQGNIEANTANAQTLVQTGGSSNAYTLTAAETIAAYAAGQRFLVRINHQNTGAVTLNVDSLGAKDWQKYSGASIVALDAADLRVGDIRETTYDGTRFILINEENSPFKTIVPWTALSGGADIEFTDTDSTNYVGYIVDLEGLEPAANNDGLRCRMSNTGGAPYDTGASDYAYSLREARVHATDPSPATSAGTSVIFVTGGLSNDRGSLSGTVYIESPHNSTRYTTIRGSTTAIVGAAAATDFQSLGVRLEEADHDAFQLFASSGGGFQAGQYRIRGVLG